MVTATMQKWGNSQGIRIPKSVLEQVEINNNDTVEIVVEKSKIIIRKVKAVKEYKSLDELFEGYTGNYKSGEWDTGKPVGKEVF